MWQQFAIRSDHVVSTEGEIKVWIRCRDFGVP